MKRCSLLLLAGVLLSTAACEGEEGGREGLSRERFVAAYVALRTAEFPRPGSAVTAADSARARADSARVRAEVLKAQGVTAEELRAFVDARRSETGELAEVWGEISERISRADSLARADSVRADTAGSPPPPAAMPEAGPAGEPRRSRPADMRPPPPPPEGPRE